MPCHLAVICQAQTAHCYSHFVLYHFPLCSDKWYGRLLTTKALLEGVSVWCAWRSVHQSRREVMPKKSGWQLGKLCSRWQWEMVSKCDQSGIWFVWIANSSLFATPAQEQLSLQFEEIELVNLSSVFPCRSEHLKVNFLSLPCDLEAPYATWQIILI